MLRSRSFLSAVAILAAVMVLPRTLAAQDTTKVDVSGKWLFTVSTTAGTGTPTLTFKQAGDTLTGHYSSQTLGEADLKGTVKDRKITFGVSVEMQGTSFVVTYSGTVEGKDSMKGTLDLGGQASGTFTGKRQ